MSMSVGVSAQGGKSSIGDERDDRDELEGRK